MRVGPGALGRAEAIDKSSFVELRESFPRSVNGGEVKLMKLVCGEDFMFVEVEKNLHVPVGDRAEDREMGSSS